MSRLPGTLIARLALIAFTGVGLLFLLMMSRSVAEDLPLFIDGKFDGFWDDVEAYHFSPQARKTPVELQHKYGTRYVLKYFLSPGLGAAYLPSERAALVNTAVYAISEEHQRNRWFVPAVWAGMLGGLYASMVLAARQTQRGLSWLVCRGQKARDLRRAYFVAFENTGIWRFAAAAGVTLPLSICDAVMLMRPELRQHGVTVFELTGWLFVLAFFSGLWMQLLLYVIDVSFLAAEVDPHRSIWNDVLVLAVFTPILWTVFQNSWLTMATIAVAALTSNAIVKWSVSRHENSPTPGLSQEPSH